WQTKISSLASRGSSNFSPSPAPRLLLPPRLLRRCCDKNAIGLGVVSLRRRSGEAGVEARAARFEGEEGGDEDFGDEDDDWSIRASMGLDRTLDDEVTIVQVRKRLSKTREQLNSYVFISLAWKIDEEDEYDKIALGKEDVVKACLWKMPFRDLVVCGFGTLMLTLLLQK
ncbi:hypothetical protein HID58_053835, partial [Brassica napus]